MQIFQIFHNSSGQLFNWQGFLKLNSGPCICMAIKLYWLTTIKWTKTIQEAKMSKSKKKKKNKTTLMGGSDKLGVWD